MTSNHKFDFILVNSIVKSFEDKVFSNKFSNKELIRTNAITDKLPIMAYQNFYVSGNIFAFQAIDDDWQKSHSYHGFTVFYGKMLSENQIESNKHKCIKDKGSMKEFLLNLPKESGLSIEEFCDNAKLFLEKFKEIK